MESLNTNYVGLALTNPHPIKAWFKAMHTVTSSCDLPLIGVPQVKLEYLPWVVQPPGPKFRLSRNVRFWPNADDPKRKLARRLKNGLTEKM
jgi:hypothetical protein